jgi:hypothetical protein
MHTEILLPDNAPPEYKNRALPWNAVEQVEKASNSVYPQEGGPPQAGFAQQNY